MPMKVTEVGTIPVHRRPKSKYRMLFKPVENNSTSVGDYHGYNLIKGLRVSFWNNLIFRTIDGIYPYLEKYPKISSKLMKLAEKFIIQPKEIFKNNRF